VHSQVISIASHKVPRILVVDDKAINRDIVDKMLSPIGFAVEQAENGEAAIAAFRSWPFDIAILDLVMPGICGKELIQVLRNSPGGSELGIIVMTGSLQENQRIDSAELGADVLLAKPVEEKLLLAEIKRLACIEYNCEDDEGELNTVSLSNEDLQYRITLIPDLLAKKLRDSINSGDMEEVSHIAGEISATDKELGENLGEMAKKFQMDRFLKIFNKKE
jgi:CheY-like chemotaxis protein